MTTCAVHICKNNSRNTGKNVRYHRFPKDEGLCNIWIEKCNRIGRINSRNSLVCSAHFTEDDYERDLKGELLNLPLKRVLKNGAVPSLLLPPADADPQPKTGDKVNKQESQEDGLNNEFCLNNEVNLETDCKVFIKIENPMLFDNSISGSSLTSFSATNNDNNETEISTVQVKEEACVRKEHQIFLPVCSMCDIKFGNFKELLKHCGKTGHAKPENFKCELCENSFCTHLGLVTHRRMVHSERRHLCDICSKPFPANWALKRHMKKHTGERSHSCEYCGKSFREKAYLAIHTRIHMDKDQFVSDGIGYRCRYCDKHLVTMASLKRHERRHLVRSILEKKRKDIEENVANTKMSKRTCTTCNKVFSTKAALAQHLSSSVHGENRGFLCSTCGKSFFSNSNLHIHLKIHADAKAYSCDICKKSFNLRANLKRHQVVHENNKPYPCKLCDASFKLRRYLKRHMHFHSGEKPHSCNFCGKKFAFKETLKTHMRLHTGESPYACDLCGKRFYYNYLRKKHMQMHDSVKDDVK